MGLSGGEKPCCTLQAMDPAMVDGDGIKKGNIVTTHGGRNDEPKQTIRYRVEKQLGKGLFGVVSQAKCLETGETVAIKKPRRHPGWYNYSELETMRLLDHPNVVSLKHCFDDKGFLYLVLEYVPETVHQVIKRYKEKNKRMPMIYVCYKKKNKRMPMIYVKLYAYQILRALAYIHGSIGVYHGDIKPENLLVDPSTHQVKLCDFGHSGKLVLSSHWNPKRRDIWSAGCVLAELLLGEPLFRVERKAYQLVEFKQFLENTTSERPWHEIFHERMPEEREEAVDLISKLLQDSPITGVEPLIHPFFDELRDPNVCLPDGQIFPPLFNFKEHEVKGVTVEILEKLIPEHARKQCDIVW